MKIPTGFVSTQGISYDYNSIMHYSQIAFSIGGGKKTIVPVKETDATLGQRNSLSAKDIEHVKALYCSSGMYVHRICQMLQLLNTFSTLL